MNKSFGYILLAFLLLPICLINRPVSAAQNPAFYFQSAKQAFGLNSEITVGVSVDSTTELNAFDLVITYPVDLLDFTGSNSADSIVDFFKEPGTNKATGKIDIVGGAVAGWSGEGGIVIKLNFKSKAEGRGVLIFERADAYLADGRGTEIFGTARPLDFTVDKSIAPEQMISSDIVPPIIKVAEVINDPVDKNPLLVFAASDAGSGVKESDARYMQWLSWSDWQKVQNPAVLPSGAWLAQLKIVDFGGNIAVKNIYIRAEVFKKLIYFLLIFALVVFFVPRFRRRHSEAGKNKKVV